MTCIPAVEKSLGRQGKLLILEYIYILEYILYIFHIYI